MFSKKISHFSLPLSLSLSLTRLLKLLINIDCILKHVSTLVANTLHMHTHVYYTLHISRLSIRVCISHQWGPPTVTRPAAEASALSHQTARHRDTAQRWRERHSAVHSLCEHQNTCTTMPNLCEVVHTC